jgi:hypothetical protein
LEQLEEKVWRYCIVAEQEPHLQHTVFFVLPDETFSSRLNMEIVVNAFKYHAENLEKTEDLPRRREANLIALALSLKYVG